MSFVSMFFRRFYCFGLVSALSNTSYSALSNGLLLFFVSKSCSELTPAPDGVKSYVLEGRRSPLLFIVVASCGW